MTLFFTYCPPHALHTAEYFFDYGLISTLASNASLVARRLVNHRVFGYPHNQPKFAANYTYHVDTSRHFVYFEVNYVRVTPRQRSSFQISDWLVWQLRDCVRVFFHVECMGIKCKVEKLLARANKLPLKILE